MIQQKCTRARRRGDGGSFDGSADPRYVGEHTQYALARATNKTIKSYQKLVKKSTKHDKDNEQNMSLKLLETQLKFIFQPI